MKNPFRTLKALVLNRRKDKVGKYIAGIGTIRTLIEKDLLFVDVKKPYVSLSLRLHLAYIDDEAKLSVAERIQRDGEVAPFVGAWIETWKACSRSSTTTAVSKDSRCTTSPSVSTSW